jgi:excisionase family DNA binding protein
MAFVRRWLSPQEVSQEYGLHVQTVYELYRSGKIPGGKIGGSVRIDKLAIERMLEGNRKK